ncbi:MAG: hypothetical protein K8823_861 [Cenarchaeum symbiont of Oopsacas minuta]|nr:hypothetical protein [Cenarchaeum symbiont of Oopsacas minuta]
MWNCKIISKELKLTIDLRTKAKINITHMYHGYRWDIYADSRFKRKLSKFQEKRPDLDTHSDDLELPKTWWSRRKYEIIIGSILTIITNHNTILTYLNDVISQYLNS